jgi:short subunit dehydrogenase-like uncharacterized protein
MSVMPLVVTTRDRSSAMRKGLDHAHVQSHFMSLGWSEVSESLTATICAMCGRSLLVVQTEGGYALEGTTLAEPCGSKEA